MNNEKDNGNNSKDPREQYKIDNYNKIKESGFPDKNINVSIFKF